MPSYVSTLVAGTVGVFKDVAVRDQEASALMAYTVSTYTPISGTRKDQITANLNIHFGVVLNEPRAESPAEVSGDEEKDTDYE